MNVLTIETNVKESAADKRESDRLDFIAKEKGGVIDTQNTPPKFNKEEVLVGGWKKGWVKTGVNEYSCILKPSTQRTFHINREGKINKCIEHGFTKDQAEKFFDIKQKNKWVHMKNVGAILKGIWYSELIKALKEYKKVLSGDIEPGKWWFNNKGLNKSELIGFKYPREMEELIEIFEALESPQTKNPKKIVKKEIYKNY